MQAWPVEQPEDGGDPGGLSLIQMRRTLLCPSSAIATLSGLTDGRANKARSLEPLMIECSSWSSIRDHDAERSPDFRPNNGERPSAPKRPIGNLESIKAFDSKV